jgi:hypothetical protein
MALIRVTDEEQQALRELAPRYFKRTIDRIRWAIDELQRTKDVRTASDRSSKPRRKAGAAA